LNGIYSLEEYYAANLEGYYRALTVGGSHNDYSGRAEGDVTGFVDYFCRGMADAFAKVRGRAAQVKREGSLDQSPRLRQLTPQQRQALGLFLRMKQVSARDVATFFKTSTRTASGWCVRWVASGFLVVADPSKKHRRNSLAEQYESLVAGQFDLPPAAGGVT
jgi:Fic family protein